MGNYWGTVGGQLGDYLGTIGGTLGGNLGTNGGVLTKRHLKMLRKVKCISTNTASISCLKILVFSHCIRCTYVHSKLLGRSLKKNFKIRDPFSLTKSLLDPID